MSPRPLPPYRRGGGPPQRTTCPSARAVKPAGLLALAVVTLAWAPATPTKRDGCRSVGLLPDPACTPGAVATTDLRVVCGTSTRGRRIVSRKLRRQVFAAYGILPDPPPGAYEIDHLIPLELGGDNSIANLWPETAPGFHDKDRVEDSLHRAVCTGKVNLDAAQRLMATDWTAALH